MSAIRIFDDVIRQPELYRTDALRRAGFKTFDFGHCVFHGIGIDGASAELHAMIHGKYPELQPTLTFFRHSPLGQVEPNDIHTDVDMGEWTGLLYLNPIPPEKDGTDFWRHRASGTIESAVPHERSIEGRDRDRWELELHVPAKFNRLLLFDSRLFHSRAIHENYGAGDSARLVQVVFGKGELP